MKAYLIDPDVQTVTAIDVDAENDTAMLASLRAHMRCQWLQAVSPENAGHDVIYLDEEGKFHPSGSFICRLWPYDVLTGRAIWIGCDGEGGNCAPEMTLDYVTGHIAWTEYPAYAPRGGFTFVPEGEMIPDITPLAPGIFVLHGKRKDQDDD